MEKEKITFSFGENWKDYLSTIDHETVNNAKCDIQKWLGEDFVSGKSVLDIGSGSGIHSLAFYLLGAKTVHSFDFDLNSVEATKVLWEKNGKPKNWNVSQGSILDKEHLKFLSKDYDIVYSWGVLHHTGDMWKALNNSVDFVKLGGVLWISLYSKGSRYPKDLEIKQSYNRSSYMGKKWKILKFIMKIMLRRYRKSKNPFTWNERDSRGMNVYHDIVDWLGGLPYEVANQEEVLHACTKNGFVLKSSEIKGEGACSIYLFSLPAHSKFQKGKNSIL